MDFVGMQGSTRWPYPSYSHGAFKFKRARVSPKLRFDILEVGSSRDPGLRIVFCTGRLRWAGIVEIINSYGGKI